MNRLKDFLIVLLAFIGVIVVASLLLGLSGWPILLIAGSYLAGGKKAMLLAFGFVAIVSLAQTIKYRNKDIFADSCEGERLDAERNLNNTEFMEKAFAACGVPYNETGSPNVSTFNFTTLWAPHQCLCNPCVVYSENGKYKATIYHTYWKNYWLFQKHEFKIVYDHA